MKLVCLFYKIIISFTLIFSLRAMPCGKKLHLAVPHPTYNLNVNTSPKLDLYVNRDEKDEGCDFFITFSKGNSSSYNRKLYLGNQSIDFGLASDPQFNNVLMNFPELNNDNNALVDDFHHGDKQKKLSYRARLSTPLETLPTGTYTDTFALALYKGRINGGHTLQASSNVTFFYNILPALSLSLVDSGAPYDPNDNGQFINFGTLEQGKEQSFDLIIVANVGYQVRFTSQNSGRLKHQGYNSFIQYRTQINSSEVNLNSAMIAASGQGSTPSAGRRIPVRFIVGSVTGKAAGQYQDQITVTVTANN